MAMKRGRIGGAVLLGVAAVMLSGQAGPARNWVATVERTDNGHRIGNPDAPVKLTEYISYTCPHCAEFVRDGNGALDLGYIQPGRVRLEVRHLLRDPIDLTVTLLAHCGAAAKFPQNHAAFMLGQPQWIGTMSSASPAQRQRWTTGPNPARWKAIANDFKFYDVMARRGYSRTETDRCLSNEALAKQLSDASAKDWKLPGIGGTPAFAINGTVLAGTHTWRNLELQLSARF